MDGNQAYCRGWRRAGHWRRMLKLGRAVAGKGKNRRTHIVEEAVEYLRIARAMADRLDRITAINPLDISENGLVVQLKYYLEMLHKHIDLVDRRLLKEGKIPHEEKTFPVFEPWVEWISKGKVHKPVEFGKRTCIVTGQWHFIVDYWVAGHQQDNLLLLPAMDRSRQRFVIARCSGGKGFFSKIDTQVMEMHGIKTIIPKKGKCSQIELQRENDPEFIQARRSHSAVESNINELEHRGLDRCPDKVIKGMHHYVGLAVIAYNPSYRTNIAGNRPEENGGYSPPGSLTNRQPGSESR